MPAPFFGYMIVRNYFQDLLLLRVLGILRVLRLSLLLGLVGLSLLCGLIGLCVWLLCGLIGLCLLRLGIRLCLRLLVCLLLIRLLVWLLVLLLGHLTVGLLTVGLLIAACGDAIRAGIEDIFGTTQDHVEDRSQEDDANSKAAAFAERLGSRDCT